MTMKKTHLKPGFVKPGSDINQTGHSPMDSVDELNAQRAQFAGPFFRNLNLEPNHYVEGETKEKRVKVVRTAAHYLVTGALDNDDSVLAYNPDQRTLEIGGDDGELRVPSDDELADTTRHLRELGQQSLSPTPLDK